MNNLRRYWLAMLFVAASFCIAAIGYGRLPQRMAVHWNLSGQADGWMPKQAGAFVLPAIALILIALLIAFASQIVRRPGVRGPQPNTTAKAYPVIVATIAAFLFYVTLGVIGALAGHAVAVTACAICAAVIISIIYSWLVARRLEDKPRH